MNFKAIKNGIDRFAHSDKKAGIIFVIGIIGIVLIALSGVDTGGGKKQETPGQTGVSDDFETESYKQQITAELEQILSKIDGVGESSVMLSVEGTAEYVFAENIDKTQDYSSNGSSEKYRNEVVITNNGSEQALVNKIIRPKISGVVVVCAGGGDITVKERVIKAVSAALNLSYGKICVEGKTKIER